MTIKLFWSPKTRASRLVWLLEELGLPYERERVPILAPDRQDSAEFRRASPMGKVPALIDGEVALSESAAIALYLADRYALGKLAPALDAPERGKFLYWMFYAPAVIEPAMGEKASGATPNRGSHGWGDFESMLTVLEDALTDRPWIMGNDFSAADIMLGSSVVFMRMFKMLTDNATLFAYADRALERPAYQKAMALDASSD